MITFVMDVVGDVFDGHVVVDDGVTGDYRCYAVCYVVVAVSAIVDMLCGVGVVDGVDVTVDIVIDGDVGVGGVVIWHIVVDCVVCDVVAGVVVIIFMACVVVDCCVIACI